MELIKMPQLRKKKEDIVVGIPRAFFYYRYRVLWLEFFKELNVKTVLSKPTNLNTMNLGNKSSVSEMCLAMKIYLGHVAELADQCDYMFVPRLRDFGIRKVMCANFEALPDVVRNLFPHAPFEVLSYDVDSDKKMDEKKAMIKMATEMGFSGGAAKKAYKHAHHMQSEHDERKAKQTEKLYKDKNIKILVSSHSYILEDDYIGRPIVDYLKKNGVTVIRADQVNRKDALKMSEKISPTLKWQLSRELVGSIGMHAKDVDGLILLTCYPCALDSMVDDMLIRKNKMDIPVLQLVLDAQSGTAGVETRLESFIDILKMRRESEENG